MILPKAQSKGQILDPWKQLHLRLFLFCMDKMTLPLSYLTNCLNPIAVSFPVLRRTPLLIQAQFFRNFPQCDATIHRSVINTICRSNFLLLLPLQIQPNEITG